MALRFIDSCAHYNASSIARKWTTVQSTTVQTSGGRRNAPYLSTLGVAKTLNYQTSWALGCAAQNGNNNGILVLGNGGQAILNLTANADATLSVFCAANKIWTSPNPVSDPSVWHYYEIFVTFSGAGTSALTATGTVWLDSNNIGSFNGTGNVTVNNLFSGTAQANGVGVVANNPTGVNFMDFYAIDTQGTDINGNSTTLTTNIGDVEIDALFPATDITTTWGTVGGDGTHAYSCVNETVPDDDTSYVTTTATGSSEAFEYQPISGFTGTILGAQYSVCAKKSAEGNREIVLTVGTNTAATSNFNAVANFLSDYYIYYTAPLDTNFTTAWTPTVFNTSTFGVKMTV